MKNKRFLRRFLTLLAVMLCMAATSTVAFAGGGDGEPYYTGEETTGGYEPQPLTPEGNMTLVDDIAGESAGDKQFITVVTKGGDVYKRQVQEHPVPHIKAHMTDPRRVVGTHKKHQISRPRLGHRR